MESKKELQDLLNKYLSGEYTTEELNSLVEHFQVDVSAKTLGELIDQYLATDSDEQINDQRLDKIISNVDMNILAEVPLRGKKQYTWIYAAAAVVAAFTLSLWLYNTNKVASPVIEVVSLNDALPGGNRATLTLANGNKINLDSAGIGQLANQSGVVIRKTADGQLLYEAASQTVRSLGEINTIETPKGGQYQVHLPDGSLVILNAASSLSYATSLNERGERVVQLRGEAYFEIFKDKKHPFIVKTISQDVEVLGTHFNVMAYANEETVKTTLLEGAVKVSHEKAIKILRPGEQSQVTGAGIIVLSNVDIADAVAWKNGYFMFSENLESIMNKIARWYDVEIVYQSKFDPNLAFQGKITRNKNLSEVLKMMEYTGNVKFKIEGRRIIVTQ